MATMQPSVCLPLLLASELAPCHLPQPDLHNQFCHLCSLSQSWTVFKRSMQHTRIRWTAYVRSLPT